jgi:hypothetical protein
MSQTNSIGFYGERRTKLSPRHQVYKTMIERRTAVRLVILNERVRFLRRKADDVEFIVLRPRDAGTVVFRIKVPDEDVTIVEILDNMEEMATAVFREWMLTNFPYTIEDEDE